MVASLFNFISIVVLAAYDRIAPQPEVIHELAIDNNPTRRLCIGWHWEKTTGDRQSWKSAEMNIGYATPVPKEKASKINPVRNGTYSQLSYIFIPQFVFNGKVWTVSEVQGNAYLVENGTVEWNFVFLQIFCFVIVAAAIARYRNQNCK